MLDLDEILNIIDEITEDFKDNKITREQHEMYIKFYESVLCCRTSKNFI